MSRPPPGPPDALARFVFERAAVRGAHVRLDHTVRAIVACHSYPPALARVLAELSAAAALLSATLKFNGSLIVQLQGDGPVRLLVVECDADLNMRATAQWNDTAAVLPSDASLAQLAGGATHGRLALMLDPKDGGQIYQGIVALGGSSVAALIEHYLAASEQIASRLVLATGSGGTRGLLVQRLPHASGDDERAWQRAAAAADALDASTLLAIDEAAPLLQHAFTEDDVRLFRSREARFACSCSAQRVANALRLIGRGEVESILAEQGEVGVTCEFCNRHYAFDAAGALALFDAGDTPRAETTRH